MQDLFYYLDSMDAESTLILALIVLVILAFLLIKQNSITIKNLESQINQSTNKKNP